MAPASKRFPARVGTPWRWDCLLYTSQALICQILQENGRVVCADLAARLQVSEHTIRRDLHELSREGVCKKVYGGAVLSLPEAGDYSERKDKNRATKLRIAQQCARLVKPGGTIFIDTGTTNPVSYTHLR